MPLNYELLKKGDPAALMKIHAKHSRLLYWLGRGLIKDSFVVETLVQDAFLKLWVHRDRIERPEHIVHFLRFVMKRECISYYTRPRNKFYREINRLEYYDNYQEYMHGYDPTKEDDHLRDQEAAQEAYDRIQKVMPLLNSERRKLIELCLKYGFQYKAIAEVMGTSITATSNEVKRAIEDIKTIIHHGRTLEEKQQPTTGTKVQGEITEEQEKVLQLRKERQYSFAAIAKELNLTQKEVHQEFMAAYKLMQLKHDQQQSA